MDNELSKEIIASGIRSISASFPGFATIGQAWTEYQYHKMNSRIEEFFENVKDELCDVEDKILEVIDSIIDREEFPYLLEYTIERVQREASEKKRIQFAHVLSRLLAVGSKYRLDEKRNVLETLDTITEEDIIIFSLISSNHPIRIEFLEKSYMNSPEFHGTNFIGILAKSVSKLESRGLISETNGDTSFARVGNKDHWKNRWRQKYYELIPYGEFFFDMLVAKA